MSRPQRVDILQKIGCLRGSVVLSYITGDRENVSTRIAPDVVRVIYRHLEIIGNQPRVDLILYTRGGDVLTPWRLVNLIREYTEHFSVLVPFRAYSAGTLLCLGADEIVMSKMGELGPIDPSVINAFNPQDPSNTSARLPVSIEDVYSYMTLIAEKMGIYDESVMAKAFLLLAEKIHPLALGNVHRNWMLIRSLANKMLGLRRDGLTGEQVQNIVDYLTEKLYAHNHMIARREAKEEIGLPVTFADNELDNLLWAHYEDISAELKLAEPFSPTEIMRGNRTEFEVASGIVESECGSDYFVFSGMVERRDYPETGQINVNINKQGWRTL
ncbi:SDH family Clp fold serine proteinase [Desulfoscipio sp. XC116]|uniref:SDH family Clp fold serine proteinase n=1 Tax=Desulfoscipio sp. XC116 TaxID=3144975 RepID=UPI00325A6659